MNNQTPFDVRDLEQYHDLASAHYYCEKLLASICGPSGEVEPDQQIIVYRLQEAMRYIQKWIPCEHSGVAKCQCECIECEKEDDLRRFNYDGIYQ